MASKLVLLDNTVLSNFALVERADLVIEGWGADSATTTAVFAEYQAGIISRNLHPYSWRTLKSIKLKPAEQAFADHLPPQLGHGERSCIAVAYHRQGLFVCDDAKARKVALQYGVPITGTIGILVLAVRNGRLTLVEGNDILTRMIVNGYRSPVTILDALL